mmetsp:Transcript_29500/g.81081  ORF Transcript_29500/g.81081 Transcript_29500/m.81081 type:complete len:247 (+) Transcript_29500:82-822(+)
MATPAVTPASLPLVELLGETLIQDPKGKKTVKTVDALKNKDLVLLYFSASWCPPCRAFSPILKEFYKLGHKSIECVYVSSDSNVDEFEGYFGQMPWLSLPVEGTANIKNKLAQTMQIRGIPALIVLDAKTGFFLTDQAREQVTQAMKASDKKAGAEELIETTWKKETTAVPLDQAKFEGGSGGPKGVMSIVMALLKNPAAIFAIMYFVKWFMRKYKEIMAGGESETAAIMEEPPAMDGGGAGDSEF